MLNSATVMVLNDHARRPIIKTLKPPVARKLAVRHTNFACLTFWWFRQIISQNSMIFPRFFSFFQIP